MPKQNTSTGQSLVRPNTAICSLSGSSPLTKRTKIFLNELAINSMRLEGSLPRHIMLERVLTWYPASAHKIAEHQINEVLIIAAAGLIDFVAEPVQEIGIEPDGDAGLASRYRDHGSALALA